MISYMKISFVLSLIIMVLWFQTLPCWGANPLISLPNMNLGIDKIQNNEGLSVILQIFLLLTLLSLAPAILIMLTSFTRIAIVFSLLRQAMGTNQMPPNQIIIGISLFLTFFIMNPIWQKINNDALKPFLDKKISQERAIEIAFNPIRSFMFKQTREKDLSLFVNISGMKRPKNINDIPSHVLIPSFIISELKTAFQIGFMLYVPFLVIDMVVASVLLSMGMMMLPPIMVSLPFKLLLFVITDGWYLIAGSMIRSFN